MFYALISFHCVFHVWLHYGVIINECQERRIKAFEKTHDVKISIDKSNSEVKLEGNVDALSDVVPAIYSIIMEVKDRERFNRELELLAKQVVKG